MIMPYVVVGAGGDVVEVVCFWLVSDCSGFSSPAPASAPSGSVVEADPSTTSEVVVGPVSVVACSASGIAVLIVG